MQMGQWILSPVVMGIIVRIDSLGLQSSNGVEFLDCGSAEPGQRTEDSSLDFCNLSVFHCINEGILRLCGVVLQLFGCVFLPKGSNFVEIHLQVVGHFFCQFIFWSACDSLGAENCKKKH